MNYPNGTAQILGSGIRSGFQFHPYHYYELYDHISGIEQTLGLSPLNGFQSITARITGIESGYVNQSNLSSAGNVNITNNNGNILVSGLNRLTYNFPNITPLPAPTGIQFASPAHISVSPDGSRAYISTSTSNYSKVHDDPTTIYSGAYAVNLTNNTLDTSFKLKLNTNAVITNTFVNEQGIYIAGNNLTTVNGVSRVGMALVNTSGDLIPAFNANLNNAVQKIIDDPSNGILYILGSFSSVGGFTQSPYVATIDRVTGAVVTGFKVGTLSQVPNDIVKIPEGLFIGGGFITVTTGSGVLTKRGNLTVSTTGWQILGPDPLRALSTSSVGKCLYLSGSTVLVWANINATIGNPTANVGLNNMYLYSPTLLKLNYLNGMIDPSFNTSTASFISSMVRNDKYLFTCDYGSPATSVNFAGNGFPLVSRFFKVYDINTGDLVNFSLNPSMSLNTVFLTGNYIYVGGQTNQIGHVTYGSGLYKIDISSLT